MTDIHRLELSAGGFRFCKWNDVMACLSKDHVTHLRRYGRTIAIRPLRVGVARVWRLDKALDGITVTKGPDLFENDWGGRRDLIRTVVDFLNDGRNFYQPGDDVMVEANQAERDGYVLAVDGKKVLVEYEMPGTTSGRITSALLEFEDIGGHLTSRRNRPHGKLPKRWVEALQNGVAEHYWIGRGQRQHGATPFPKV